MNYQLTQHAQIRRRERRIEARWLEQAIATPQLTEPDAEDPSLEHRLAAIPARGYRVLPVVCDPRATPVKIITAHFDRSMKGKM